MVKGSQLPEDTAPTITDYRFGIDTETNQTVRATRANDLGGASSAASNTAWQSWVPTWTNLTVSGSTVTAKYTQIGKTVHFRISVVLAGGNAPTGTVTFSLPVTSVSYAGVATTQPIGNAAYNDSSVTVYSGFALWASTTTAALVALPANSTWVTYFNINGTNPFTFGNGDEIFVQGTYEAA